MELSSQRIANDQHASRPPGLSSAENIQRFAQRRFIEPRHGRCALPHPARAVERPVLIASCNP